MLAVAFAHHIGRSGAERQNRAEYNSLGYADEANKQIKADCAGLSASALIDCIKDKVEAAEQQRREEYDLTAQQDMSDWAFWLLWVSVGTVAVSSIATVLIWLTLRATRDTLELAEDANRAAQDAVDVTREIGEKQVRAYITLEDIFVRRLQWPQGDSSIEMNFKIRNSGQTPAFGVVLCLGNDVSDSAGIIYGAIGANSEINDITIDITNHCRVTNDEAVFMPITAKYQTVFTNISSDEEDTFNIFGYGPIDQVKGVRMNSHISKPREKPRE